MKPSIRKIQAALFCAAPFHCPVKADVAVLLPLFKRAFFQLVPYLVMRSGQAVISKKLQLFGVFAHLFVG